MYIYTYTHIQAFFLASTYIYVYIHIYIYTNLPFGFNDSGNRHLLEHRNGNLADMEERMRADGDRGIICSQQFHFI